MRCLVVYDTDDDLVVNYWWCSTTSEYVSKRKLFTDCYPKPRYEVTTEYERSSYCIDDVYDHS